MTATIPPTQPPGTPIRINLPIKLEDLPSPIITCDQGVYFDFATDASGFIIGVHWHHTRVTDGQPCVNMCFLNLPLSTVPKDLPLFDVHMWDPFTLAYYWCCYATDGNGKNCGRHGMVVGSRWLEV